MKIKIVFVILVLVTAIVVAVPTATITSKAKDREFARTEKVYIWVVEGYKSAYDSLASKARVTISNTYSQNKNKKGVVIYEPTSTIEIDRMIDSLDKNIKVPVDSLIKTEAEGKNISLSFIGKLKNLFK